MKKRVATACVTALLHSLILSGCSNDEPKAPPAKDATAQAIEAAKDKAHAVVDKTAAATQSMAEKAIEIKGTATKAAADLSATLQKDVTEVKDDIKDATTPASKKAKVEGC